MIATGRKIRYSMCTGGERDLPLGTVFHMYGDKYLVQIRDVGNQNIGECCSECYFQLVCRKLKAKAHEVVPHCSCEERPDRNNVFFVAIDTPEYGLKYKPEYLGL